MEANTRNVTEKKAEARGRGRPRKADALTNAQRQAAYRARRRQQSFTETEPAGKAAADDVRKELEAARAIIADLRAQKAGAELERDRVKKERDEARRAYKLFQAGHVELAKYHDLTDTYHRIQGQLYEANHKLALAEEQARKFVTHNGNTKVPDILEMAVLEIACKRKTAKGRMQLYKSSCLVSPTTKFAGQLFVHGWGASRTQFLHRATEVSSLGCICLTIELGARNTSRNLAEVVAAYDKLAEHPEIDPNAIGMVGSSYGGYIAALATELRAIRWLALRAPALPDVEEEQAQSLSSHQTDVSGKRRVIAADRSEALRACTGFKGDAFVVESQFDEIVPRIVVRSYIDAFIQASSITYRMLSGADHGLSAENNQQAYTKVLVRWLREMVTDARVSEGVTATRATPVVPRHPKECDAASAAASDQNAREAQAAGADLNVQIKN